MITVIGRFKVNDKRKRIKRNEFSNENNLVWTGENKKKKRLCAGTYFTWYSLRRKRMLFKQNTLVWLGPQS